MAAPNSPSHSDTLPTRRIAGIDAFRGFVMLLMMAEVLHLAQVSENVPTSGFWQVAAFHQTHVPWTGCSLHDLIQPAFSFLVGVALPFSIASRRRRDQSVAAMTGHAAWRAVALVLLGVLLRSLHREQTYWTFEDTLSQIGLGYLPLFLLGLAAPWMAYAAFTLIVVGYWTAFVLYPLPPEGFDFTTVGVPADWPHHAEGLAAHFNKNANLATAFDRWFLNLFPREDPFEFHRGAYATLSFIPTLATMILGLIAGRWLQRHPGGGEIGETAPTVMLLSRLVVGGGVCLAIGWGLEAADLCPIVKRIWTPAWVFWSGGWCLLMLAGFYGVCDLIGFVAWAWPLRVIGANSIVAYVIAHLWEDFFSRLFTTHFGNAVFVTLGGLEYEPLVRGIAVLACYFGVLWWMWSRRVFVKI